MLKKRKPRLKKKQIEQIKQDLILLQIKDPAFPNTINTNGVTLLLIIVGATITQLF